MDFFERQEQARGRTKLLVFLFISAIFLTFAATLALVAWFAALGTETTGVPTADVPTTGELFARYFCEPTNVAGVFLVVALLIGGGSLFKIGELRRLGADGVALALGGRRIARSTTNWSERRLYNIVEEMALASGVPTPSVYVLDAEDGVNACAIGDEQETAAIAVTDGALRRLSRDELQGVVAHEFGHILNGDVKMNMRLIGVLFGLQMLTLLGVAIFRSAVYSPLYVSSRDSNGERTSGCGAALATALFAFCLIVIGSIGVFISSVIRAAISRQREFLADASAAQFTRNPAGLAGALKKIGGAVSGSRLNSRRSAEMAHLFFASVFSGGLSALFKTHPDLTERIRRLDPTFDGNFEPFRGALSNESAEDLAKVAATKLAAGTNGAAGAEKSGGILAGTVFEAAAKARVEDGLALSPASLIDSIGRQTAAKLDVAASLLRQTPSELEPLLADCDGARAVLYALLADPTETIQKRQLEAIRRVEGTALDAKIAVAFRAVAGLSFSTRSTVARLALPALKTAPIGRYRSFRETIIALCEADGKLDLFEYALQAAVVRELDVYYRLSRGTKIRFSKFEQVVEAFRLTLSYLAVEGAPNDREAARKAFDDGCEVFYMSLEPAAVDARSLGPFSRALNDLSQASPSLKRQMLTAFYRCVASDGVIIEREAELLEAITAALGVPAPLWASCVAA